MEIIMKPIGYVHNEVTIKKDHGWGRETSRIVIDPKLQNGLAGLADFSHIIVVYYLHEANFVPGQHIVRRPQGREDMPMVGILSQRAKDRPNPIGITSVKLVQAQENIVTVQGLDAISGTPVLDIKPYYPVYDAKKDAAVPQWVDELMKEYF